MLSAYFLLNAYMLPAFKSSVLSTCAYYIIIIKISARTYSGVEAAEMATREAMATGEVMTTGEAITIQET